MTPAYLVLPEVGATPSTDRPQGRPVIPPPGFAAARTAQHAEQAPFAGLAAPRRSGRARQQSHGVVAATAETEAAAEAAAGSQAFQDLNVPPALPLPAPCQPQLQRCPEQSKRPHQPSGARQLGRHLPPGDSPQVCRRRRRRGPTGSAVIGAGPHSGAATPPSRGVVVLFRACNPDITARSSSASGRTLLVNCKFSGQPYTVSCTTRQQRQRSSRITTSRNCIPACQRTISWWVGFSNASLASRTY